MMNSAISEPCRLALRLQGVKDIGPIRFGRLCSHFGSVEAVLSASQAELQKVDGIGEQLARGIFETLSNSTADLVIERAAACGVHIVCRTDPHYPTPLRTIADAPIALYLRGIFSEKDNQAIGIVGTRRCSHYGSEQARRFAEGLARAGFTIVSGLARGIDGHAHRGALDAGGRTIAVLGNGFPDIYPPEHQDLAKTIETSGAVVTELPMDCAPDAKNFPRRNRIIAGLSLAVIVIEAGKNSGALITADVAHEYGRKVLAIPGRIDDLDRASGVHELIRSGRATLITCVDDVLDALESTRRVDARLPAAHRGETQPESPIAAPAPLSPQELAVLEAIQAGAEDADAIGQTTSLAVSGVIATLTSLELKSRIRRLPGNRFALRADS